MSLYHVIVWEVIEREVEILELQKTIQIQISPTYTVDNPMPMVEQKVQINILKVLQSQNC